MSIGFKMWALGVGAASAVLLASVSIGPTEAQGSESTQNDSSLPLAPIGDDFTLAVAGDIIYLRPMLATLEKQAPDVLRLLRGADVAFGNFETSSFDLSRFKGAPQAESGGTWMLAYPATVNEVAAMGFDIVSHANNHATDWGVEGLFATHDLLNEAGLIYSGTGATASSARNPAYLDTARGRVSLVSATTTFTAMSRAGDPLGSVPGRPGVNAIRSQRIGRVSAENLDALAKIAGVERGQSVELMGTRYDKGGPEKGASFSYKLNDADVEANMRAVRQARQNSNLTVFSLHNHEPGNASETPSDFASALAHKIIDSGADVVIGHGPHQIRGIEIYRGKPIFYSLGNFAMMNNSLDVAPADMFDQFGFVPGSATVPELLQSRNARTFADDRYFEAIIATLKYSDGRVSEIRLHPLDLGLGVSGAARGVPKTVSPMDARRILERVQRLSTAFRTKIVIEGNVGIIRIPTPQDKQ